MFQQFIILLTLMGLFAGQLAAFPHEHVAMSEQERQSHDATPHVHFDGHRHSHHKHDHAHHQHEPAAPSQPNQPLPEREQGIDEHDATAIYLSATAVVLTTPDARPLSVAEGAFPCTLLAIPKLELGAAARGIPLGHPPDAVLDGSSIYLTLRNLRI